MISEEGKAIAAEHDRQEAENKAIEQIIANEAKTDGAYAIAYALLMLRNQAQDIGEQLYKIADCLEVKESNGS